MHVFNYSYVDRLSGCSDFCILVQMMLCKDPCTYLFAYLYKAWRRSPISPMGVSSPLFPPGSFQMKSMQPRCFRQRLHYAKDPLSKTFCGGPGGGRARVAWQGGGVTSESPLATRPGRGDSAREQVRESTRRMQTSPGRPQGLQAQPQAP